MAKIETHALTAKPHPLIHFAGPSFVTYDVHGSDQNTRPRPGSSRRGGDHIAGRPGAGVVRHDSQHDGTRVCRTSFYFAKIEKSYLALSGVAGVTKGRWRTGSTKVKTRHAPSMAAEPQRQACRPPHWVKTPERTMPRSRPAALAA